MNINDRGGVLTVTLLKGEAERLLHAVYLARRLAKNIDDQKLAEAADVIYEVVKKYGAEHLDEKGELKPTQSRPKRDASEAPKDIEIPV